MDQPLPRSVATRFTRRFSPTTAHDVALVGGKKAALSEMHRKVHAGIDSTGLNPDSVLGALRRVAAIEGAS